jgi:hypothetical protein
VTPSPCALIAWRIRHRTLRENVSNIAGCRGIIPLPGCLRGSAPQGFAFDLAFQTPLRGHKRGYERFPSETRRGTTDPRRGVRGERGQRPRSSRECKTQGIKVCIRVGEADARCDELSPLPPFPRFREKDGRGEKKFDASASAQRQRRAREAEAIPGFPAFDFLCVSVPLWLMVFAIHHNPYRARWRFSV